jgi:hypothetical protein
MGFKNRISIGDSHIGTQLNIPKELNATVQVPNNGFQNIAFHFVPPTDGTVQFEATFDLINWEPITLRGINSDTYTNKSSVEDDFIGSVTGARIFRFKTIVAGSVNGSAIGKLGYGTAILEGIEFGNPPHRFGFDPVHKDASFTNAETGTTLWQPASGKKFVVTDFLITASGATDGLIKIFDETDATGNYLYKGYVNVSAVGTTIICLPLRTPFVSSAVDNILKLTTDANIDVDIILHGYEI